MENGSIKKKRKRTYTRRAFIKGMGGLAPVPWRRRAAEEALRGKRLNEDTVRQAAKASLQEARPLEENAYKVELAEVILSRAVMSLG